MNRRHVLSLLAYALIAPMLVAGPAQAADKIRIGLPAKAYWPSVTTRAAEEKGLFAKEGIEAEITAYRSGAEAFEALVAGAADLILAPPSLTAVGIGKGIRTKVVAGGATGTFGWYVAVKDDSPIKSIAELQGKKIGITSAGSVTDLSARWAAKNAGIDYVRVPLGGGIIPNLLSGNVDGAILYSPLSYQVIADKQARPLIDLAEAMPPSMADAWIASERLIAEKPAVIQRTLNALFGGVQIVQGDRDYAVTLISEVHEIPKPIAETHFDQAVMKLLKAGEIEPAWLQAWYDLASLGGLTGLAPVDQTYTTDFKVVPTAP